MEYKKRIADQMLTDKLDSAGAVLVEGPKYCGKTTLAKQQAGSVLSMADPLCRQNQRKMRTENQLKRSRYTIQVLVEYLD